MNPQVAAAMHVGSRRAHDETEQITHKFIDAVLSLAEAQRQIDALRGALVPFAALADECPAEWTDAQTYKVPVCVLRAAKRALEETP